MSDSFFRRNDANMVVRKPANATLSVYTAVEGEGRAMATIDTQATYISFLVASRVFSLSAARPKDEKKFAASICSTGTSWSDVETRTANLTISVWRQSQPTAEVQRISVSVSLRPYPSCTHTTAALVKRQLEHTEEALVRLHPRDSEGLPIRQTKVSCTLWLYYEGEQKHIF